MYACTTSRLTCLLTFLQILAQCLSLYDVDNVHLAVEVLLLDSVVVGVYGHGVLLGGNLIDDVLGQRSLAAESSDSGVVDVGETIAGCGVASAIALMVQAIRIIVSIVLVYNLWMDSV